MPEGASQEALAALHLAFQLLPHAQAIYQENAAEVRGWVGPVEAGGPVAGRWCWLH